MRAAFERFARDGQDGRDGGPTRALLERLRRRWTITLRGVFPLGGSSAGNELELHRSGDEVWHQMWGSMRAARERIWMETYMLVPDRVGERTRKELVDAAARGLEVVLLYDYVGSSAINEAWLAPLRAAGVAVHAFNPIWPWRRHGPILQRDHRKILICDRDEAWVGGLNVGADYAGKEYGNGDFRDTHMRVRGPACDDLAALFAGSLRSIGQPQPASAQRAAPRADAQGTGSMVQVLESNVQRKRWAIQRSLRVTLERASLRCFASTPYFVPPLRLRRALVKAARRGLDVRVLTAGRSDVPLVSMASQHVYAQFLRAGVRIYEYGHASGRVLHAKTLTLDGVYSMVGSFNFDNWSWGRNLEVSVAVLDAQLAAELERHFAEDLAESREVSLAELDARPWWKRWLHALAYHLARL